MQKQTKKLTCTPLTQNSAARSLSRLQNSIQRGEARCNLKARTRKNDMHQPLNQTRVGDVTTMFRAFSLRSCRWREFFPFLCQITLVFMG